MPYLRAFAEVAALRYTMRAVSSALRFALMLCYLLHARLYAITRCCDMLC